MPRGNAVVAVDLGTSKVCTIVAEALADGRTSILGVGLCPAKGMAKGVVVDLSRTTPQAVNANLSLTLGSGLSIERVKGGAAGM